MIRAFHAGLGKVRLGMAHIRAILGRFLLYLYLRPLLTTHNAERASKSVFWYYCTEREGTVVRSEWHKPLGLRVGHWLARKLGLRHVGFRRDTRQIERDKYALCVKGILLGLVSPKPITKAKRQSIPPQYAAARPKATGPRISRLEVNEGLDGGFGTKPLYADQATSEPPEAEAMWAALWTEEEVPKRKRATRKAAQKPAATI